MNDPTVLIKSSDAEHQSPSNKRSNIRGSAPLKPEQAKRARASIKTTLPQYSRHDVGCRTSNHGR